MAENTPSPRRRLQFRLRTMLIGVTLFCVAGGWFGNQVRIVREREEMAAAPGVDSVVEADSRDHITALASNRGAPSGTHGSARARQRRIPWIRNWLGDRYYLGVSIDKSASDGEITRYQIAFPEAVIMRRPPGGVMELFRLVTQPLSSGP